MFRSLETMSESSRSLHWTRRFTRFHWFRSTQTTSSSARSLQHRENPNQCTQSTSLLRRSRRILLLPFQHLLKLSCALILANAYIKWFHLKNAQFQSILNQDHHIFYALEYGFYSKLLESFLGKEWLFRKTHRAPPFFFFCNRIFHPIQSDLYDR